MSDDAPQEVTHEDPATTGSAPVKDAPNYQEQYEALLVKNADLESKVKDWKTHAREWEDRAKKSEPFKEKAEELEASLGSLKHEKDVLDWKSQVSKDTGVPADVLRGDSVEEIQAHAEQLKSLVGNSAKPGVVPTVGQEPSREDANVPIPEQIRAAQVAGNKEQVQRLKALMLSQ